MDQVREIEQDVPCQGMTWHQNDILGPQRRGLSVFVHSSYDRRKDWHVVFSVGMATNDEKAPLIEETAACGMPLNPRYFIDAENLELWIDNALAGLCRCRLYEVDNPDEELGPDEPLSFTVSLGAVFIRPLYRSLGFGELLNEQLAELIVSGILTHLMRKEADYSAIDVALTADF